MAIFDLLELGELLLSWRLYVGFAITVAICYGIVQLIPNDTAAWVVCAPVALVGVIASFRWQIKND